MKKFLLLAIPLLLIFPFLVHAQSEIQFSNVSVDILPEYDRSSVLYVHRLTLRPSTTLPARIIIKIPSSALINAVAVQNSSKELLDAPYDVSIEEGWAVLTITANSLIIQFEYYEDLNKTDHSRNINYEWTGAYATDKLVINLLVPNGSQNLSTVPPALFTGYGLEGLANYQVQATNLPANQTFLFLVSYNRASDALEISDLPIIASSAPGLETPGRITITGVLPWILGALGIILVAIGIIGFFVWQKEGKEPQLDEKPRKKEKGDQIYCKECGKRAQPGDKFCRNCGTRLKVI